MDELRDRNEPQEVVGWYTPRQGNEVVDYYVHRQPLPECVRPAPPQQTVPQKKKRRGLWIFLGVMGALAVVLILAALLGGGTNSPVYDGDSSAGDGSDDASSITDIYADHHTTIPKVDGYDPTLRMAVLDTFGDELTATEVFARVNPAVVMVVADQGDDSASVGTGVIMTADGYVVTNAHVISGGASCWVALDTGDTYDALLVGYDADEDIAVLKLVDAEDLPVAEFGNSDLTMVGEQVYAIGNPLGIELRCTLTDGIISAVDRDVQLDGRTLNVIQTTAALNNGNSGGPLISRFGQVIGINTMKMSNFYSSSTTVEGIGFAIPIDTAKPIIDELIEKGYVSGRPAIGIDGETLPATYRIYYRLPQGIYVTRVYRNSDAAAKGISEGDIITAINGVSVTTMEQLNRVKNQFTAGQTITLTIYHGGVSSDVEIILMDRANA